MAVAARKTIFITTLDTTPPGRIATGEGAPGFTRIVNDQLTAVAADTGAAYPTASSQYRFLRIPANAKIKVVRLTSAVAGGGACDVNIAYSDSAQDGTPFGLTGGGPVIIAGAVPNRLFGAARTLIAQVDVNITYLATFTRAHSNLPLWQVLVNLGAGLLAPGPTTFPLDIVLWLTTSITTGGIIAMECWYVE